MGEILEFAAFQGGEDLEEPEDMESEDYEDWARRHEALEDLADDILDLLEE